MQLKRWHDPHSCHRAFLTSELDAALALVLLLKLDMTLRMDSRLMEEEALPGFLGLLPVLGLSVGVMGWLGTAEKGLAALSCLELLASRRSCTVMRTRSTACMRPGHPVLDAIRLLQGDKIRHADIKQVLLPCCNTRVQLSHEV